MTIRKETADALLAMVRQYGDRRAVAAVRAWTETAPDKVREAVRAADATYEAIRYTLNAHSRAVDPTDDEDTQEQASTTSNAGK